MTKSNQNTDFHLFNAIAVQNRVPSPPELEGITRPPLKSKEDIDLNNYIPNDDEEHNLKNEFKVLLLRDLVKYDETLKWMESCLPTNLHLTSIYGVHKAEI